MTDYRPLGAPIQPPSVAKPDEWEDKIVHGTRVYRNKRTGLLQTDPPKTPPVIPNWEGLYQLMPETD